MSSHKGNFFMEHQKDKVNTKIAESYYEIALSYQENNKVELAINNYRQALSYDSDFILAKRNLDKLLLK